MKNTEITRKTPLRRTSFKPTELKPAKGPRTRKCRAKGCSNRYILNPEQPFICWCSEECGAAIGEARLAAQKAKKAKAERAEAKRQRMADKVAKEQYKKLSFFEKRTERKCNEYIRLRDAGNPCISCDTRSTPSWQAGHYISVGANPTIRYNEFNINLQCSQCNVFEGGNPTEYRKRLVEKYGLEKVEWLEGWHPPVKMTRELAMEIEAYYDRKIKELKATRRAS